MRSGFFRRPVIESFDQLLKQLLTEFDDASIVPVAESKGWFADRPNEIITYVWLTAKKKNLNVEMVRRGWFEGGTQLRSEALAWKLLLPAEQDRAFIDQVKAAEEEARSNHRGIWKELPEKKEN